MITPPYLKPGDQIGIVATARKVSPEEMKPAIQAIGSWGLEVRLGKYLFEEDNQYAGSDEQRTFDLQQMLDDPEIKAIICARGGYGTVRIIDRLDFSEFEKKPKWIAGYSDITVLHSHIHRHLGIETIHATMPLNFPSDGSTSPAAEALRKCLFGEAPEYRITAGPSSKDGNARGLVTGGNLSILYSLCGSPSDVETEGKILFIEDLDEYLYHIDRMMMNLKRCGKLERLAGLVVGGMTQMRDNSVPFGKTAEEIIADVVKEYKYPVLFGFPAGHQAENMPLLLGREATLEVSGQTGGLSFSKKTNTRGRTQFQLKPLAYIAGFYGLLYLLYALLTGNL
ncbi:MAG: muramoyltetrapeptide carboxypeptidase [Bacteroidetes bacterium]|nr:MAG: muramoyltetrapeptide carboxypeptidase [Bacteroidota bacterium]